MRPALPLLGSTLALLVLIPHAGAQGQGQLPVPRLVANLGTAPVDADSGPHDFHDVDGKLVFSVTDSNIGPGIWMSDGSAAGTLPVGNPLPDTVTTWDPKTWVKAGGKWFFASARVSDGKMQLWATDGSGAGTVELGDAAGFTAFPPAPQNLTACGDLLYFTVAHLLPIGPLLWRSDGTKEGTFPLGELNPTPPYPGFTSIKLLTPSPAGDVLWFAADNDRLFRTGGTLETTMEVDYSANFSKGWIHSIVAADQGIFFICHNGRLILAKTDGSAAGTVMIGGHGNGSTPELWYDPWDPYYWNGALYFNARTDALHTQLYRSDGSAAGTSIVKVIKPSLGPGAPQMLGSTSSCLFVETDDGKQGRQLWSSDGTAKGTRLLKKLGKGLEGIPSGQSAMSGGKLWFSPFNLGRRALWVSDGTPKGTRMVKSFSQKGISSGNGIQFIGSAGGVCYLSANDGVRGFELWKSDGSAKGTVMVKDIAAMEASGVRDGMQVVEMGGAYYFTASTRAAGSQLWRSDGTAAGTAMFRNFGKRATPYYLSAAAGRVNFHVYQNGREQAWSSDGTAKGTRKEKPFPAPPREDYMTEAGGKAFAVIEKALYVLRPGHREGPLHLDAVGEVPDLNSLRNNPLAVMNGEVYLAGRGDGPSLWKSDGTPEGTVEVCQMSGFPVYSTPYSVIGFNGSIYFLNRFLYDVRLWKSDGSEAGTTIVAESSLGDCDWLSMETCGGKLYILGRAASGELRLFRWEGSGAPVLVKAFTGTGLAYSPYFLHSAGNLLYLSIGHSSSYAALWRSDGTEAGTFVVRDSYTYYPVTAGPWTYFVTDDGVHGDELWRTDGSTANTALVADLGEGRYGSLPQGLRVVGERLLFSAETELGRELWAIDNAAAAAPSPTPSALAAKALAMGASTGGEDPPALLQHAFNVTQAGDIAPVIPGSGTSGYPAISTRGEVLRVEYLRRKDGSLIYTPQYSESLAPGSFQPMNGSVTVTDIDALWERVVAEQPYDPALTPRLFARVEVKAAH